MRAMWKGAISFGLVTIPVKLYAATEDKDLHFKQLHKKCGTPVQYRKYCPACEVEVDAADIVKGFEFEKERYVTVAEDELESIPIAATRTVEIVDFIHLEEVDPVFYDRTYYLEPGEGGSKPYALLRRAMMETGRIAVAKVVMRSKESLAAIRVFREGVLALETMHFPDEVRSPAGLSGIVEPELRPQELEMAKSLVLSLSAPFEPAKYQNEYRDAVLQILSAKAQGVEPVEAAAEVKPGRVVDLMSALQASIQAAAAERGAPAAGAAAAGPDGSVAAGAGPDGAAAEGAGAPAAAAPISPIIIPGVTPAAAGPVESPAAAMPGFARPAEAAPAGPSEAAPAFTPVVPPPAAPPIYSPTTAPPGASAPPPTQPTAAAPAGAQPPDRRPTAPRTLPGGRRPLPPTVRRPLPPGSIGQSVWQYRPEL